MTSIYEFTGLRFVTGERRESAVGEKRVSRREEEKQRQRNEMFSAALELFSKKGFHNVSMQEIAQRADFAIGTVYKFFKNKEDLYKSMLMTKAEEFHETLKEVLDWKGDPLTILRNYVSAKGAIFAENVESIRLYFAETQGASYNVKAGLDRDIQSLYDEVLAKLTLVFKSGIRKKLFRKLDPYYMAVALEGLTNSFLFCWLEDTEAHPYEQNVAVMTDMFLEGVAAK
jgi:AcrR family transcriptional regulator